MKRFPVISILLLGALSSAAYGGQNEGGALLFHANPSLQYSSDNEGYNGQSGVSECEQVVARADGETPVIFYALAAFAPSASPCVKGVEFGVTYDNQRFSLLDWGTSANFELPSSAWPTPNSSTAVVFFNAHQEHLFEVYWFAGYALDDSPSQFEYAETLHGAPVFGDCTTVPQLDEVAILGALGINGPGVLACPTVTSIQGACCFERGVCEIHSSGVCEAMGGVYLGDDVPCDFRDCQNLPGGHCCRDGDCLWLDADACVERHGIYLGDDVECTPDNCEPLPRGACCLYGTCSLTLASDCERWNGEYHGDGTSCEPDPCQIDPTAIERGSWGSIKQRYR